MKCVCVRVWGLAALTALFAACAQEERISAPEAPVLAHAGDATPGIEWAIPPRFDKALPFAANGLAAVEVAGRLHPCASPIPLNAPSIAHACRMPCKRKQSRFFGKSNIGFHAVSTRRFFP